MMSSIRRAVVIGSWAVVAASAADTLYVVNGANESTNGNTSPNLYILNPATCALVQTVGPVGFRSVTGLSFQPGTGVLYAHSNQSGGSGQLIRINPATGAGTLVGTTHAHLPDMAFRSDGTLFGWVANTTLVSLVNPVLATVNVTTGALSLFPNPGTYTEGVGLEFAANGTLYATDYNYSVLYTVNTATGGLTHLADLSDYTTAGLALGPDGKMYVLQVWYGNPYTTYLATVNLANGTVTRVCDTHIAGLSGLTFAPSAGSAVVPIGWPALMLIVIGLGVTAAFSLWRMEARRSVSGR